MTIVEVLAAAAVTAAIMTGVLAVLAPAQRAYATHADIIDARQRLRVSADALVRDVAMASALDVRGDALAVRQGSVERVYYLSGGELRQDSGAADFPVADGIAALSFEPVGRRLRVRMAAAGKPGLEADVVFEVAPRNALPE